jgi:hypothetical protein
MARGWESKSVEDQIEARKQKREDLAEEALTEKEWQHKDRLKSLNLSKSRLLAQLERAKHPTHRATLLSGLQAIEKEIDEAMSDKG